MGVFMQGIEESSYTNPLSSDAISLENVNVHFKSYRHRATSLKQSIIAAFSSKHKQVPEVFRAISDINLKIPHGQILGVLGSNGSGKSTLLKVISGVLSPTSGKVRTSGEIASLIELGAGFDPELTAIENIYLHGSLHRKSKAATKERISKILDFAELTEFGDTPVKYFSSGMFARLGFSAAIDINPEILILDEILSVGDQRFQAKSGEAIKSFFTSGKTIILVSHDLELIKSLAHRVILLSKGRVIFSGHPSEGVEKYQSPEYQTALG
jgi:ABC-type polysaccharide/polyol phosphate transport system ATPase subunit